MLAFKSKSRAHGDAALVPRIRGDERLVFGQWSARVHLHAPSIPPSAHPRECGEPDLLCQLLKQNTPVEGSFRQLTLPRQLPNQRGEFRLDGVDIAELDEIPFLREVTNTARAAA